MRESFTSGGLSSWSCVRQKVCMPLLNNLTLSFSYYLETPMDDPYYSLPVKLRFIDGSSVSLCLSNASRTNTSSNYYIRLMNDSISVWHSVYLRVDEMVESLGFDGLAIIEIQLLAYDQQSILFDSIYIGNQ